MSKFTCHPSQTEVVSSVEDLPWALPSHRVELVDYVTDEKGRVVWVQDNIVGINVDDYYKEPGEVEETA